LDILISKPDCEMIIDTKYKLKYQTSKVHQDIRQVAGYARLKKVRNELKITDDRNIDCLIIYPDVNANALEYTLDSLLNAAVEIDTYHKVYKLGVSVPLIENGTSL
jgi:5-methylcytosine-specific restriction enzyme subunit McrC